LTEARLFHIVDHDTWTVVEATGEYRPSSLVTEGFVHCSFASQVAGTAALRFAGVPNLDVIEFARERVPPVRVEDSYGSGMSFPHIYGPVPTTAVLGRWPLSEFIARSVGASPDR